MSTGPRNENPIRPTWPPDEKKPNRPANFHDITNPTVLAYLSDPVNARPGESVKETHERLQKEDLEKLHKDGAPGG